MPLTSSPATSHRLRAPQEKVGNQGRMDAAAGRRALDAHPARSQRSERVDGAGLPADRIGFDRGHADQRLAVQASLGADHRRVLSFLPTGAERGPGSAQQHCMLQRARGTNRVDQPETVSYQRRWGSTHVIRHPEVVAPPQAQPAYTWLRARPSKGNGPGLSSFEARFRSHLRMKVKGLCRWCHVTRSAAKATRPGNPGVTKKHRGASLKPVSPGPRPRAPTPSRHVSNRICNLDVSARGTQSLQEGGLDHAHRPRDDDRPVAPRRCGTGGGVLRDFRGVRRRRALPSARQHPARDQSGQCRHRPQPDLYGPRPQPRRRRLGVRRRAGREPAAPMGEFSLRRPLPVGGAAAAGAGPGAECGAAPLLRRPRRGGARSLAASADAHRLRPRHAGRVRRLGQ